MSRPFLTALAENWTDEGQQDVDAPNNAGTHLVDGVVGVTGVPDGVGTSDEGLEGDVGDESSKRAETLPGVLVQESHGDVERRSTPALESEGVLESVTRLLGDVDHVD